MPRQRQRHCSGSKNKDLSPAKPEDALVKATPTPSRAPARSWAGIVKASTSSPPVEITGQLAAKENVSQSSTISAVPPAEVTSEQAETTASAPPEPLRPGGLGTCLCRGRVAHMKSTYGWIEPLDAIEHPDFEKHGGLVWFSFADVRPGTFLLSGNDLMFGLYADIDGLGAEDVCEIYGKARMVSAAPVASEVKPFLPLVSRTPLSFASKSFTPGLGCHYSGSPALPHCTPVALQLRGGVDDGSSDTDNEHGEKTEKRGDLSPASTGTGGESIAPVKEQTIDSEKQVAQAACPPSHFLPPPGLPPPPGLEDCSSLKIEG